MHHTWDLVGKSAAWTIPSTVVYPFRPRVVTKPGAPYPSPAADPRPARCRTCGAELTATFLDLGLQPAVGGGAAHSSPAPRLPLCVAYCGACHLVQLAGDRTEDLGPQAAARTYAGPEVDSLIKGLRLGSQSMVVEIASGSGDTLIGFQARGIGVLGVEADRPRARVAADRGIPTRACEFDDFLARRLLKDGLAADLLIAHNAVARAPRLGSFLAAARRALKANGVLLMETPHLLRIVQETRFDAFRHEQLAYLSLLALERALNAHGLRVVHATPVRDAALLRVYACRIESTLVQSDTVAKMLAREKDAGLDRAETYVEFGKRARAVMERLRVFIRSIRDAGKTIVAYGAAPEGDALLAYCGIGEDAIAYVADPDATKHGTMLPGTRIAVASPERIRASRPDFLLVLPGWPVQDVVRQHSYIQSWGGRFGCLALR